MTRSIFLRLMLVALGLSALLAIVSIYATGDASWRMMTSTIFVAVACGLMLPVAPREAGGSMDFLQRTVLGFIAISLAICLALTWDLFSTRTGSDFAWVWFVIGTLSLAISIVALRSRRREDRSLALAERAATAGGFISLLSAILVQSAIGLGAEEALVTGFICVAGTVAAASSAIGRRAPSTERFTPPPSPTRFDRALGSVGLAAGIAWSVVGVLAVIDRARVWQPGMVRNTSVFWPFATFSMGIALGCAIWCGIGLSRVTGPLRYLRHTAALTALALGMLVTYATTMSVRFDGYSMDESLGRFMSALIVVGITSLIAALVMMRLNRGRAVAADPIESLDWICPRCATRAQIGAGEHSCTGCGLAVLIQFRDDRCPACAYDLRGQPTSAAQCPECGRTRQTPVNPA